MGSGKVEVTAGTAKLFCVAEVRLLIGRGVSEGSGGSRWRLLLWGAMCKIPIRITLQLLDVKS